LTGGGSGAQGKGGKKGDLVSYGYNRPALRRERKREVTGGLEGRKEEESLRCMRLKGQEKGGRTGYLLQAITGRKRKPVG